MERLLTQGSSIYHRLIALYARQSDGTLLRCTNKHLEDHWDAILADKRDILGSEGHVLSPTQLELPTELIIKDSGADNVSQHTNTILLERPASDESHILGVLIKAKEEGSSENKDDFFLDLVLHCTHQAVLPATQEKLAADLDSLEEQIVDIFDKTLRNVTPEDQWSSTGRAFFLQQLKGFTRRNEKIEFVLPAFPCKSSNSDKVGNDLPDRGEMFALTTLHNLVRSIEKIYTPGARVLIVSDGHVFSDCIGVEDSMVDTYSKRLRGMNETIKEAFEEGGKDRVAFQALPDLLQLKRSDVQGEKSLADRLDLEELKHPIEEISINTDAETSRRMLMQGFGADPAELRGRIDAKDPKTLALYRGFSRFMLEDLEKNSHTEKFSKSKLRKLSSKVAFEMIERNQAYSNMIEMLYPYHLRLSIHAHNNAGPKFGINLMGPKVVATDTLPPTGDAVSSHDLLHVPTPWHGCIVEIAGHENLYMTMVEKVEQAIEEKKVIGAWVAPAPQKKSKRKDSSAGKENKRKDSSAGEESKRKDSGAGEESKRKDSGAGEESKRKDSSAGEESKRKDSGAGEESKRKDSGTGEESLKASAGCGNVPTTPLDAPPAVGAAFFSLMPTVS